MERAVVWDPGGFRRALPTAAHPMLPSASCTASAPSTSEIPGLNARPAASLSPLRFRRCLRSRKTRFRLVADLCRADRSAGLRTRFRKFVKSFLFLLV